MGENEYKKMMDLSGLMPVMQNIAGQSQNAQQLMQSGNQLANQALTSNGFTPQQMASALRNTGPTQLSPEQKAELAQLGSNSWNPWSDYNRGTNGWGNYGE